MMPITKMEQEPSLIQASNPETAHREHDYPQHDEQQSYSPSKHSHAQYHNIQHRRLRGRQAESINSAVAESAIPPVVTELIQTISIIQQINVDEQGNTIGVTTYTTSDEPLTTANFIASSEMPSSASSDTIASSSLPVSDELPAETSSVVPTTSAEPVPATSDLPASAPVFATPFVVPATSDLLPASAPVFATPFEVPATVSAAETFASLKPSINATLIVSSSSLTTFLSSTTSASSSSSSSTTSLISIDSLLSSLSSTNTGSFTLNAKVGSSSSSIETTSTSSAVSYTSSQAYPSTTGGSDLIAGAGAVGAPNAPFSGDSSSSNDASNDDGPAPLDPPKIAGAVVGGVAGLAALLILAFYILRHMKQKRGGAVRLSASSLSPGLIAGGASPLSEKRSPGRFLPIYNAFRTRTNPKQLGSSEAAESNEPSFVRISGRKLPSVLQHGGDGYGGPGEVPPIPQHLSQQLNDTSFYADDTGYHGGTGDKGVSTAVAGGALAATAAGQREKRSVTPSTQNQPSTPLRHPDIRNPFTSPDDSILPAPRSDAGAPLCRDGAWRSALVSQTGHDIQRHKSHKAHLSSGLSSSPEQPHTGNTETSGSTNYTDAREYDSLDNMLLRRPDPLGRSHPSQDGSKGSRFREDV